MSPNFRPSSNNRRKRSKSIKKTQNGKVLKKEQNQFIKTSTGYKKKLVVKSIAFTEKKLRKGSKLSSTERFEKDSNKETHPHYKSVSSPVNMQYNTIKFNRQVNIPIK